MFQIFITVGREGLNQVANSLHVHELVIFLWDLSGLHSTHGCLLVENLANGDRRASLILFC
jgi:hypothetical protein